MTLHPDATPGECLTLGGHDGSPCSKCGHKSRPRPPAIPKHVIDRERQKYEESMRYWFPATEEDEA